MGARRHSMALRMMAVIGVVTAAAMVIFSGIVLSAMSHHFEELDELTLREIRTAFLFEGGAATEALSHVMREHPDAAVALEKNGRLVVRGDGVPAALTRSAPVKDGLFTLTDGSRQWRGLRTTEENGAILYCLTPMDVHLAFHQTLKLQLFAALVILILAVLAAVWFTVKRGLAPVEALSRRLNEMTADRLGPAADEAAVPSELSGFAAAFNRLLARIADVLVREKQFSADIAHELKTPVTNLTVQTEVALARPRSNEELENILYSSLEEYRRLSKMIEDMLFLARIDNAAQKTEQERFELKADIADLTDFFSDWADERGVAIRVTGDALWVTADRLMVRRAVTNLITNAAKHTAAGGAVTVNVALQPGGDFARIAVANPGSPIAPEHLPHLFDRFYRADPSRNRQDGGTGIGLAMVASIARLHGGDVAVKSDAAETVFAMTLPVKAASA